MISIKGAERDEKGRVNKRKNMNVGVREGSLKREGNWVIEKGRES